MVRVLFILLTAILPASLMAQNIQADQLTPDSSNYENIYVKKIAEDSLHSTFCIWIKKGVKAHYHAHHTEHVIILEGSGEMTLGDSIFNITKGDIIIIPQGTVHAVKTRSLIPLKVLSIQSPTFDGDRIFVKPD